MNTKEKKGAKAENDTIQIQNDKFRLQNYRLKVQVAADAEELKLARRKLHEFKEDLERRLIDETKLDIQAILKCSDMELERLTRGKPLAELEKMLENMLLVKGDNVKPFMSIRAGADSSPRADNMFTLPDTYGKTPSEIRKLEVS